MTVARTVVPALAALITGGLIAGCASSSAQESAGASSTRSASTVGTQAVPSSSSSAAACTASSGTSVTASRTSSSEGTAPALQSIQFTDPSHGWAAGAGRIVATTDGGSSWTQQYSGSAALSQVDFTDAAHGWAVGQGTLLRTTDGGSSWTPLGEPGAGAQCQLDSVHFVSPSTGYAIAGGTSGNAIQGGQPAGYQGAELLRTTDGGVTWQRLTGAPADPQSVCATSATGGYLGTPGRIWRTADGGQTWSVAFTEPPAAKTGGTIGDTPIVQCAGPSGAWVLFLGEGAAMLHSPYLAYATQNGKTWQGVFEEPTLESVLRPNLHLPAGPGSEAGPFSAISPDAAAFVGYTPPANGFGAAPLVLATGGGSSLSAPVNIPAINQPLAASFVSPAQGWVVGENLKTHTFAIEATSTAGRTWTTQYTTG